MSSEGHIREENSMGLSQGYQKLVSLNSFYVNTSFRRLCRWDNVVVRSGPCLVGSFREVGTSTSDEK